MANRLDIIAIRIQNECAIIIWVVDCAYAGWTVVLTARRQGSRMKLIDPGAIAGRETDVNWHRRRLSFMNPELRLTRWAETAPSVGFFDDDVAEYCQYIRIKRSTHGIGTNFEADMVKHDSTYQ